MLTYLEVFGFNADEALALNTAVDPDGTLQIIGDPVRTLSQLLERLKNNYDSKFPNGAENFVIDARRQNISVDEQRITYTISIDRFIETVTPLPAIAIVPAA